jgi:hypothetical protein
MSHSRLSHIVAVEKSVKGNAAATLTTAHHQLQRNELTKGITRVYRPLNENDHVLPSEATRVQISAETVIEGIQKDLVRLFDVTVTKDQGNLVAHADVVIDGQVLVSQATVPTLLFLEKQLVDLTTFIKKLPVLDPSEHWVKDDNTGHYKTQVVENFRTNKVYRNHVKAEATDKHPAQVEVYQADEPVGVWSTVKFSGALQASRVKELTDRVVKLQEAVKVAREEANATEVENKTMGEAVLGWLFA